MQRIILIFGLVVGTLLCINMVSTVNLMYSHPDFEPNDVVGYAAMVVVYSLIFFGIRNYRNKELSGFISFGKAFKTGFYIALIGSTMYVAVWLFYYYLFVPDFLDVYAEFALKNCAPADVPAKTEEIQRYKELYKNPLFVILLTYAEVLPVGLVVTLLSALILKKKQNT